MNRSRRTLLCVLTGGTFQFVSALEATKQLVRPSDKLFLYTSTLIYQCPDLMGLQWQKNMVVHFPYGPINGRKLAQLRRFVRRATSFARSIGPIDILITGTLGGPFNALANALRPEILISLDEGIGTYNTYQERQMRLQHPPRRTSARNAIKHLAFSASTSEVAPVSFFTVFDDIPTVRNDKVIPHRFQQLKGARTGDITDHCLVLGSPASRHGLMSPYNYRRLLTHIDNQVDLPIIYKPHHSEIDPRSYTPTTWMMDYERLAMELRLIHRPIPRRILGWASTALVSSQLIVGDVSEVRQVAVPSASVDGKWSKNLRLAERIMAKFNIDELI